MPILSKPNTCGCGPECDKCACGCHSRLGATPYFVITELVAGDTTIKLAYPAKIGCQ